MQSVWNPILITEPTDDAIRAARVSHETMLVSVLDAILERYERDPGYPFIDTKLNLITGEDFSPEADPARDVKNTTGSLLTWREPSASAAVLATAVPSAFRLRSGNSCTSPASLTTNRSSPEPTTPPSEDRSGK